MNKYERPTYGALCAAGFSTRDWADVFWGKQTWRGAKLQLEVCLSDDQQLWWWQGDNRPDGVPFILFAGLREFVRLAWDDDADGWYEREAARLAEQAPA